MIVCILSAANIRGTALGLAVLMLFTPAADAQTRFTLKQDPATAFSDVATIPKDALDGLINPAGSKADSKDLIGGMLVVQDTKDQAGVARANSGVGVVVVKKSAGPKYSEVEIDWPAREPASDLEAVCRVPGQPLEYLVAESGYYRADKKKRMRYGRVFRVKLSCCRGIVAAEILEMTKFPKRTTGIEGLACVGKGNNFIAVFGERDSGKLRWTQLKRGSFPAKLTLTNVDFKSNESLKLPRHVTGLFCDENGLLWVSSAEELSDFGPFRSVVQLAGTLTYHKKSPLNLYDTPVPVFYSASHKIEGITEGLIDHVPLSVATEDEDLGGLWFPLHPAWLSSGIR